MRKIYISDLDGTLLKNNARLSDYSRENMEYLLEKGVNFTVASARSYTSIKYILGDVPLKLPIIEHNGAYISDYNTGKHIIINSIEEEVSREVIRLTKEYGSSPLVSAFTGKEDKLYYGEVINEGMELILKKKSDEKDPRLTKLENIEDALKDQITTLTIINKRENLIDLYEFLKENYGKYLHMTFEEDQYYPGWHWLVITSNRATKARAIETLLELEGVSNSEVTVFGDSYNDIPMFKIAKNAVAVLNAKKELKDYATDIIGTNEKNSVINYILQKEGIINSKDDIDRSI